jgi:hypothetical protein
MHKPAQTIPPETRGIINDLRRNSEKLTEENPTEEKIKAITGKIRGLEVRVSSQEHRIAVLELENYALRNWIAAHETGVRTTSERRCSEAERVADCGRVGDAG